MSFWESNPPKTNLKKNTASSLLTTNSQSMVSLNNNNQEISNFWAKQEMKTTSSAVCLHEVDEKRGFTPSDVAKDPAKREFLTNLSKRIFSPSDAITTRLSRHKQVSKSFRVRRKIHTNPQNIPKPSSKLLLKSTKNSLKSTKNNLESFKLRYLSNFTLNKHSKFYVS